MAGNETDAKDLSQIFWIHVFEKFPEDDFLKPGILHRKAYQIFVDEWRKRKVRSHVITTDEVPEVADMPIAKERDDLAYEKSLYERFWSGFPGIGLTDQQKASFWYHERYGYTMRETADKVGAPHSTVGGWIQLCKKRCLEYLNREEKEEGSDDNA